MDKREHARKGTSYLGYSYTMLMLIIENNLFPKKK
jgi:hypothetical protein